MEKSLRTRVAQKFKWMDGMTLDDMLTEVEYEGDKYILAGLYSGKRQPASKWPFKPKIGMNYWAVYDLTS